MGIALSVRHDRRHTGPLPLEGHKTFRSCGYTFLELMVVITLIGIFLLVAIPRIAPDATSDGFRNSVNWFSLNVPRLKRLAVSEQTPLFLHIDRRAARLWVSTSAASEGVAESAPRALFTLPETVALREIVTYGRAFSEPGPVAIRFSPNGTSGFTRITLVGDDGREADIHIEPFLYAAKIHYRGH